MRVAAVLFGFLLVPQAALSAETKLYPVDEASKDPSFVEFRNKLVRAAQKRDLEFVLSILDPKILNSFSGDEGIDEFKQLWKTDQPHSALWGTLRKVLSMGGSFSGTNPDWGFMAPYVYSRWPHDVDPFEYAAITGSNVLLRRKGSATAPVVAHLSYDIVKVEGDLPGIAESDGGKSSPWVEVTTLDGNTGYVSRSFIYSPVDYRIIFEKRGGEWRMRYFVAGD